MQQSSQSTSTKNKDLMITVSSLDNATSDCRISITANDMKSYQNTVSFYSVKVTGVIYNYNNTAMPAMAT